MANEMGTEIRRPSVTDKRRAFRAQHQRLNVVVSAPG
jgi:hypothetical protein